jgi:hypothetical protein
LAARSDIAATIAVKINAMHRPAVMREFSRIALSGATSTDCSAPVRMAMW